MAISIIHNQDTRFLNAELLDSEGFCRVLPAQTLMDIDINIFRLWCVQNAVYLYPTLELVEWLKKFINNRNAIEVGSGNGHLGHALGIKMTDSGMQMRPEIMLQYKLLGQACTCPPDCVEILDAENAVAKYKPDVVIASWLTHKWKSGMSTGNMYGPDESMIIANTEHYIHIGNDSVHWEKPIMSIEHQIEYFPWIVSRASNVTGNHAAIWGNITS